MADEWDYIPPWFVNKVSISWYAYKKLQQEALNTLKERGLMYEVCGVLFGFINNGEAVVTDIERLPEDIVPLPKRTLRQKLYGIPTAGEIASNEVNSYVAGRGHVIGFYHTHPFLGPKISLGDKRELKNIREYPNLIDMDKVHIITPVDRKVIISRKGDPGCYVRDENGDYVKVGMHVLNKENLAEKRDMMADTKYAPQLEARERHGINREPGHKNIIIKPHIPEKLTQMVANMVANMDDVEEVSWESVNMIKKADQAQQQALVEGSQIRGMVVGYVDDFGVLRIVDIVFSDKELDMYMNKGYESLIEIVFPI